MEKGSKTIENKIPPPKKNKMNSINKYHVQEDMKQVKIKKKMNET